MIEHSEPLEAIIPALAHRSVVAMPVMGVAPVREGATMENAYRAFGGLWIARRFL